jgi:hypothetical protein
MVSLMFRLMSIRETGTSSLRMELGYPVLSSKLLGIPSRYDLIYLNYVGTG